MTIETKNNTSHEKLMELLEGIKQRVMDSGIEFARNEKKFKEITENQLEFDTTIDIKEYSSTGHAVIKNIQKSSGTLEILMKNVDYSDDEIKLLNAEYVLGYEVGYGFGTISYKDTNTYFCGLIKDKKPFLMGFFVENKAVSFKIDVGLEYGMPKFISTDKNITELIIFIEELHYKKALPNFLVTNIIMPAYKNQAFPFGSTSSVLESVKIKYTKKQVLEKGYEVVLKNWDLENAASLQFKVFEDGQHKEILDGGLNKVLDLFKIVDDFYRDTGITLWHLDSLKNKLNGEINTHFLNSLKKEYSIPQSSPIFLSQLDKLESNTIFYYVENDQVKEITPNLSLRYKLLSNTGRAYYYIDSSSDFWDKMEKYAFKWSAGFSLDILFSHPSMNMVPLIKIDGPKVYKSFDLIKETLFK